MHIHPYKTGHCLRDGRLYVNDEHQFLKTGKPLRNYGDPTEVRKLMADLPVIASKGYKNLAINCYWHHFNPSGDGRIEVSLEPLYDLLKAVDAHGMYASLSVETYGVGGGQIPQGFWDNNPETEAITHEGNPVRDTEYGYNTAVPSLFSPEYLHASRAYMKNLVEKLGAENFLYFETTVEPQYMGSQNLDYSRAARESYEKWLARNPELNPLPFPDKLPASQAFIDSKAWNIFRAQNLASWINGDARAYKEAANGAPLWIATDYLDAENGTMNRRLGDPVELLRNLTEINIIQVNWSWCNIRRKPNQKAYDRVHQVMREHKKDWAITEHMTLNGADYFPEDVDGLLSNTLKNGTRFGWEFVDIAPDFDDPSTKPNDVLPGDFKPQHFSLYDSDWQAKPVMSIVDNNWSDWVALALEAQSVRA
ncbi:hypothetical protein G0Q06_03885 [Puniceicoccales bacterium CK1056]|uniref:Uncharacterized protein n=1 Tax=Oceanipulchritudo coccoides TaxID=2706888 RepID=A0A6B2LZK7_9BACT|nr:hypothetical protein [Oceanipulchritudo coccoides]NDV61582.1 hypothetical protein [Oceanipulchritudo coccoides]